jgi:hypothetical protein
MAPGDVAKIDKAVSAVRESEGTATLDNFYLSCPKYGYPGTDGSWWSNYKAYVRNNHELVACFGADPQNPFRKHRRVLVQINNMALTFLLATLFARAEEHDDHYGNIAKGILIGMVMGPYGIILQQAATCQLCHYLNCCVKGVHIVGDCMLVFFALFFSAGYISSGIYVAKHLNDKYTFWYSFGTSILFRYFIFFVFGITNWLLHSWGGFCCMPQFNTVNGPWPKEKKCAVWTFLPIQLIMNSLYLCEVTYDEDKEAFESNHPGQINILSAKTDPAEPVVNPIQNDNSDFVAATGTSPEQAGDKV